ncbi:MULTISPECIES: LexA family protein [Pseudomonas]|uniref:XRE family transcriptional regulator n=2 Tax=Pseudomonas fragariae (ex Marin et al. 2024) TaxID=3080056 RepID=A0ABU5B353_9PSED|nr:MULTISPECIES: XRE family transcriptional regulator [Pseudomonas]MCW6055849.1 XRE family transcriptional regulator [Pseudomonas fragi]MCA5969029.1 XRE family transcriptional regulator [Pseudomonas sp. P129]MCF5197830.1 XRE family transcriptional regulator [Pseudomonas syringae]MCF5210703.1 XRE family transcriptional regulator [Pseudomonas syringae]MCF5214884.1 XRE family transcriptional regulator [Pseudomonas syringae]
MKISDTRLQNLKRVLSDQKLRLTQLADRLGKAPAQVSAFAGKNPTKGIGDQIAREIEKALGLHMGYLDLTYGVGEFSNATVLGHTGRKLPVIGSIAAGSWCDTNPHFDLTHAEDWIEAPGPVGPRAFILRVEGVSMEPKFSEGDKVVIDPSLEALPGHFVAAKRSSDDAATLKQLRQEGNEQYLYALNPDWPDRIIKMTEKWTICGRARWIISDL